MTWTNTDAAAVMDGRYRLHYSNANGGGALVDAGAWDTLLEAQVERSRWATVTGWDVRLVRGGRFVVLEDDMQDSQTVVAGLPGGHQVRPDPAGYYAVTSGRSGRVYHVTPLGGPAATCTGADGGPCEGFRRRGTCSHIDAVRAYAVAVLG